MLWEVKQSLLIIGSLGCYMALCKMAPFLPWKGHRTASKQCSAPILPSPLSSSSAWKSCCPTVIEPLFSVSQRNLFTLRREACFVLESFPVLSLELQRGTGQQGGGKEGKLYLQQLTEWQLHERKAAVHRVVIP